jgi:hypothetical protein
MPEDSCDRLLDGCQSIAAAAAASDATMWEVFAIQSYGLEAMVSEFSMMVESVSHIQQALMEHNR